MISLHIRIEIWALYCIVQTHSVQERDKELLWAKWVLSTLSVASVRLLRGEKKTEYSARSEKQRDKWIFLTVEEQTVRKLAETKITLLFNPVFY